MIQVRFFFLERLQVRYWAIRRRSKLHRAAPCRDRFICFSPGVHDQPTATRHSTVGGHVYNKLSSRSYRDGQSTCPKHFYRAETTNTSFGEQLEFSNVIRLKVIQHGEQEIWDILSLGAMAPTVDCGAQIQKSAALTTVHICCTWNNSWTSLLLLQYTLSMKPDVEP